MSRHQERVRIREERDALVGFLRHLSYDRDCAVRELGRAVEEAARERLERAHASILKAIAICDIGIATLDVCLAEGRTRDEFVITAPGAEA